MVTTKKKPSAAALAGSMAAGDIGTQQRTNSADAATKAKNVNAAARAASGFLDGLGYGKSLSGAYRQAGKDQAALGAGYSQNVRGTVDAEAAKVNRGLAAIGSPSMLPSTSSKAADVVYALGGAIPASSMLANAPLAVREAQIGPTQLLGYGQQQAAGTLGAAALANRQLETQLPGLKRQYLNDIVDRRTQAQQQRFQNNLSERQLRDQESAQAASERQAQQEASAAASAPDSTLSGRYGYVVNSAGQAIPGADGRPQLLPGYVVKNGRVVKTSSSSGSSGGFTPHQRQQYVGTAQRIAQGSRSGFDQVVKSPSYTVADSDPGKGTAWSSLNDDGKTYTDHHPPLTYQQALQQMLLGDPSLGSIPRNIAVATLNKYYPPAARVPAAQINKTVGNAAASIGAASGFGSSQPVYVAGGSKVKGMLAPGNINLSNRPEARNSDGTISTVRSITVTDSRGRFVLIPTVIKGRVVSNNKAIAYWKRTGQNLGSFSSEKAADSYAVGLHGQQDREYPN